RLSSPENGLEILPDSVLPPIPPPGGLTSIVPSADAPLPVRRVFWRNAVRIIPSQFPPVDLFERVASAEDIDAVPPIEAAFNPRLRDAAGDLSLVPKSERVVGPGAGYIMGAFTHVSPD